VRPYLPSETQGYVPNFIAAAYLLNYHTEHNIIPVVAKVHNAQLDTMCLSQGVHMATISKLVNWDQEDIKALNPVYKTTYIPHTQPNQCITGPLEKIGLLVSMEDSLYVLEKALHAPVVIQPVIVNPTPADSSEKIMEWNALKTTNIYVGQRLQLLTGAGGTSQTQTQQQTPPAPVKKYYNVKAGDTFSKIAQRHGLSQAQLSKLNPGVNINKLTVGQRLRVK
jgi:membrane-bound lytic murein transglycosylase D